METLFGFFYVMNARVGIVAKQTGLLDGFWFNYWNTNAD